MDPRMKVDPSLDAIKKRRYPIAMTAVVVTFTVVGTLYGASLRQKYQIQEVNQTKLC
jgi:uncharacterized protein involved in exopolysaccharide biosynthesis